MLKFLLLFITALACVNPLSANPNTQVKTVNCSPALQPYLKKMLTIPEVKNLVTTIQNDGSIKLETNNNALSQKFKAFWDVDHRIIGINLQAHETEGQVIGSILFEMHNALASKKIDAIDQQAREKRINRTQYIEAMEFMEYENSLKAAAIATRGIELGIFPKDARLPTYKDFAEHFYYQKISGHSAWFGKNYDMLFVNS